MKVVEEDLRDRDELLKHPKLLFFNSMISTFSILFFFFQVLFVLNESNLAISWIILFIINALLLIVVSTQKFSWGVFTCKIDGWVLNIKNINVSIDVHGEFLLLVVMLTVKKN